MRHRSARRVLRCLPVALALAAAVVIGGCSPGRETTPSSQEARAALDRLVTAAQRGDFETLCTTADGEVDGNCLMILDEVGRDVPRQPPTVVAERTMEAGPHTAAGRVLTVCGRDDQGRTYRSEVLFFYQSGQLDVIQPVWWSGYGVAGAGNGPVGNAMTATAPPAIDCG